MTTYEYTYLWWEGSTTSTAGGRLGDTTPPIGEEVIDKINGLAADGWEVDQITAAPLTTGWISPGGRVGSTSITAKVHYLAILRRAKKS
jgi:hypothetical protein